MFGTLPCFLLAAAAFLKMTTGFSLGHDGNEGTRGGRARLPSKFWGFVSGSKFSLYGSGASLPIQYADNDNWIFPEAGGPQVPIGDAVVHDPSTKCTNPVVRKEWRTLTVAQKKAWIRAVNCLARYPGSGKLTPTGTPADDPRNVFPPINSSASWYDDLAYVHLDLNTKTHQTGLFFPWHRYFLWSFERTLEQRCGYTGFSPYWDWSKDAHDFQNATIWDPDPHSGLGGFGDGDDLSVRDGGFAGLPLAYPSPHTLRRQYTPYPFLNLSPPLFTNKSVHAASTFTPQEVQKMVSGFRGDYRGFQTSFEHMEGMHMSVHFIMGGDISGLCPGKSAAVCSTDATPNEPMFWMHHAMVDKVWFDWQHAHLENYWAFDAGTVRDLKTWPKYPVGRPPAMTPDFRLPNDGVLIGNYTVHDMFNTTSNGPLCYTYE